MKILQVNRYHFIAGGAERYYFNLSELLSKNGEQVVCFSQKNIKNIKRFSNKYFINELSKKKSYNFKFGLKIFSKTAYNFEAAENFSKLLWKFKPDIIHLHGIVYHISPSILVEARRKNIPVIMTLHDYSLLSPNLVLFHNGKICEVTKKRNFYKAFFHKCVRNSYIESLAGALIYQLHDAFGLYEKNIDLFIAPSRYIRQKYIEYGYDKRKIIHLNNFINTIDYGENNCLERDYVLYFGRIQEHKGVGLIIEAAKRLPSINFIIMGDGSEKSKLQRKVIANNLKNVTFLPHLPLNKMKNILARARYVLVPSVWYENQPYTILETFALGKPVIASRIGGIPEVVINKKNGFLFEPGNINEFTRKILELWENKIKTKRMGVYARKLINERFSSELHYRKLMKIYRTVLRSKHDELYAR